MKRVSDAVREAKQLRAKNKNAVDEAKRYSAAADAVAAVEDHEREHAKHLAWERIRKEDE